jgi:hypothetical protein
MPLLPPSPTPTPSCRTMQALLEEKRALEDSAERHWQQQQMQIAVGAARARELEAALQRQRAVFETEAVNYDKRLTLLNEQLVEQVRWRWRWCWVMVAMVMMMPMRQVGSGDDTKRTAAQYLVLPLPRSAHPSHASNARVAHSLAALAPNSPHLSRPTALPPLAHCVRLLQVQQISDQEKLMRQQQVTPRPCLKRFCCDVQTRVSEGRDGGGGRGVGVSQCAGAAAWPRGAAGCGADRERGASSHTARCSCCCSCR